MEGLDWFLAPTDQKANIIRSNLSQKFNLVNSGAAFYLSFSIAQGKIHQEITKSSLHAITLRTIILFLFIPRKHTPCLDYVLTINYLLLSTEAGKHSISNRKLADFIEKQCHTISEAFERFSRLEM